VANLARYIRWEIIETFPPPVPDGSRKSWMTVRRAGFNLLYPETIDVLPVIVKTLRENFPRRALVEMQARIVHQ
jgi:hypothetical protein